jgi:hypothetical protein
MRAKTLEEAVNEVNKTITVSDARDYFGGCIPGWKGFAETYGFDWKTVLRYGLSAKDLLATGDEMAKSLVESVYKREDLL